MATPSERLEGGDDITDALLVVVAEYVVLDKLYSLAISRLGFQARQYQHIEKKPTEERILAVSKI